MSVTLRQTRSPDQRIDLQGLLPGRLADLSEADIGRLPWSVGNRRYPLGELFSIEVNGGDTDRLVLVPLDGRIDRVGAGLDSGSLVVEGDAGDLVGAGMTGGSIRVTGSIGAYGGSAMRGGEVLIEGDSGDHLGGPTGGRRLGQQGGLLRVRGKVGACAGERMRRGLLLIEGDSGERLGHRMIAGTLYCGGSTGELAGYAMRRGTLLLRAEPASFPCTFADNGRQALPFLPLLFRELRRLLLTDDSLQTPVRRFVGDLACDGRGEILVLGRLA